VVSAAVSDAVPAVALSIANTTRRPRTHSVIAVGPATGLRRNAVLILGCLRLAVARVDAPFRRPLRDLFRFMIEVCHAQVTDGSRKDHETIPAERGEKGGQKNGDSYRIPGPPCNYRLLSGIR